LRRVPSAYARPDTAVGRIGSRRRFFEKVFGYQKLQFLFSVFYNFTVYNFTIWLQLPNFFASASQRLRVSIPNF